jgi:MFS transporter, SP family, solute carrier family 2 (myo-inositol transporter), member 13
MIIGRSIVGAAIGSASFVAPLYIGELAPSSWRGRLVTVGSLFVTGGQVVAYLVGWVFSESEGGWRWMVGLGAVPAILQVILLAKMPESPRWLIKAGYRRQAEEVLRKVYGKGTERVVGFVVGGIEREVEEEAATARRRRLLDQGREVGGKFDNVKETWRELVGVGGNRRALTIACMLQGFQQLCGFVRLLFLNRYQELLYSFGSFQLSMITSLTCRHRTP